MKRFLSGFLTAVLLFCGMTVIAQGGFTVENPSFPILVNGKVFQSDLSPLVVNGSTYLPLKALGEVLGVPVSYDSVKHQVTVGYETSSSYSRKNPAPLQTEQTITLEKPEGTYALSLKVSEVLSGDQALTKIMDANKYNPEPKEGYEYLAVKVTFSLLKSPGDRSYTIDPSEFFSYSANYEENPQQTVISPSPSLRGRIYAGTEKEGYIVLQKKTGDKNPLLAFGLKEDGTGGLWFHLS